jgi:hypothetical protein
LAAVEVEGVDAVQSSVGEVGDAAMKLVVGGQLALAGEQRVVFLVEAARAGVDLAGATSHLGVVDHPGLVEIGHPCAFGVRARNSALQSCQLGGQQLVVGGQGVSSGQGGFSGGE